MLVASPAVSDQISLKSSWNCESIHTGTCDKWLIALVDREPSPLGR
jgi:hypothetical protein